ncbi:fibronectin type III domain protein [marine gamma proteobacterium HTCC2080]|nr:fibronectin type III domain protein [marine gamma proteobacterium HTCC2080]
MTSFKGIVVKSFLSVVFLLFVAGAHAQPSGLPSATAVFLKPHPGTEISTRDKSYRCSNSDGCYWEPIWVTSGAEALPFLELTASPLEAGKLDFVGWQEFEAGAPQDELYPFRTWLIWQDWLNIERGTEFRTFFEDAEFLLTEDQHFRVGFLSAPDFWSNNFEMDIPSCVDTTWYDQEQREYGWTNGRIELNHHTKLEAFDMTGDGRKDIVMLATCGTLNHDIGVGTESTGYLIVLEQTASGGFIPANRKLFGQAEVSVGKFVGGQHFKEVDDYNGDGRMDFVLASDRDNANDGVAEGLWQSALATSEPYPQPFEGGWLATDFLVLSQSDGSYDVTSLGEWNKVFSAYRDSRGKWTVVNFALSCDNLVDVISGASEWSCEPPAALEVNGDDLIDVFSSVYLLKPGEESPEVPRWSFKSGTPLGSTHNKQLKHHHEFDSSKRHLTDSAGKTISMSTRGGGVQYGSPYFTLSVFGNLGPEFAGATEENEHFTTFRYGGGWAGLTVYGNHYLPIYHEDYHLFRARPGEDPVILADIFGFRLEYFDQEKLDALPGQPGRNFCGMGLDLEILGIPNGHTEEECLSRDDVWAADRFYAAFSLREDGTLVALPLDQNPTYDDRFDWGTQTHRSDYVEGGGQAGSHVANLYSKPFKDVNGDGYEDYIEFDDAMLGNSWRLRPDLCPDAIEAGWGPNWEESSCRFVNLMVNDQTGSLRRVALESSAIPFDLGTTWQHFADLNDDGVIDILNLSEVKQVRDIHNVLELGIYYGKSVAKPSRPVVLSTDYDDREIILRVRLADDGGVDIIRYDASCTDGTNTYTGTSATSPITVSGLTNDVAYTCTVTATNSEGTSPASAATDPIIPAPEAVATVSEIQITEAYIGLVGRAPDPGGLAYWVNQLDSAIAAGQARSLALKKLTNDITLSAEWDAGIGANDGLTQSGAEAIVRAMYLNLFDRPATASDVAYWSADLTTGRVTESEMVVLLILGAQSKGNADSQVLEFKRQAASYYSSNITSASFSRESATEAVADVTNEQSLLASQNATDALLASSGRSASDISDSQRIPTLPAGALLMLAGLMLLLARRFTS